MSTRPPVTRCLVADDHPAMVEAVCEVLSEHGIEVIGRARDGDEALTKIEARKPDVAVVDLRMPRLSGVEIARRAARIDPETGVILYTAYGERALLTEALDAGARGFVLKEAPLDDLVRAVETVAAGGTYVDPVLAGVLASTERAGRPVADPAGARRPSPARGRALERGDRQAPLHLARDRADAHPEGDGQARRRHEDAGGREGAPPVSDRLTVAQDQPFGRPIRSRG